MKKYCCLIFFIIITTGLNLIARRYSTAEWKKMNPRTFNNALKRSQGGVEQQVVKTVPVRKDFVEYYTEPLEIKKNSALHNPSVIQTVVANPELYNTQFLKRKKDVRELLLTKEGFFEEIIKDSSKNSSSMLYKIAPNARYAFVCFGGWGMGKESLAPLYEMLKDQQSNIFLCEARTIGQSIVQNAWDFGMYSEQDVIHCIAKAHELSPDIPLVIWGTCAGAFYATRALVILNEQKKLAEYRIGGLIFDSGWGAVDEAIVTQWKGRIKEKIARTIAPYTSYTDYRDTEKTLFVKMVSGISNWLIDVFSWYTIRPLYMYRTYKTNLNTTIGQLSIPIFFIHSKDDWLKPLSMSKQLYEKASNKIAWWIDLPSTHSMHHFKHKEEYKKRCIDFINRSVLNSPNNQR